MNVKGIVEAYLKTNGYNGLFTEGECACVISDLFPYCDDGLIDCEAGYKTPCPGPDQCDFADTGDHFHIGANKPEVDDD